jgi:hypothetical protein
VGKKNHGFFWSSGPTQLLVKNDIQYLNPKKYRRIRYSGVLLKFFNNGGDGLPRIFVRGEGVSADTRDT